MLEKSYSSGSCSCDSVVYKYEHELNYSLLSTPRASPLKDTTNLQPQEPPEFCVSRHNPNKTFRRESVIASWKSVKKEREQALGKRFIYVDAENHEDYYGRNQVKRCKSERMANGPKIQRRVKRTYSVLYRYDPSSEKVVKEYKYLKGQPELSEERSLSSSLQKSHSEPFLTSKLSKPKKNARRSITTLLSIKTKFLNIFRS